ncbi:Carboxyl/Cholinesterase 65 [Frankliniella occidentalis]|uniref:Carboxylic ester hydrolase n=2 Tax=Frankliniella occidentalis TaxID=133901 RepID=A0A6J1SMX3_FRAOC|nr:esterase B1 isoform X1 [Frankliniella occidentalis]XP_026280687.1 esterase B1 isoform X1 [Frankliniella occidentalis]XP_052132935.1 esterase B1 isoform X1 [Frankliniella occidentalis]KAE8736595.1 Carboxyl/Cholinesterase 65 [Frankliniella occidentalis]
MSKSIIIKTEKGPIRGKEVISDDTKGKYFSFQGIPYARPPVGPLRFKPPEDLDSWTEVKDCQQEADPCIQHHMYLRDLRGSEDCLYLNVYSPQLDIWGASKLPVMVRIHGGGFTTGSAGVEMNGPDFIVQERVILVTIGYRLNMFGFLCVEEPGDAQGNMGLKDQVAALKWVQRNISSFGGDPKRVTIAGESAGGASVHLHMMSPMSQGLFSSAISESGVAINPWAFTNEGRSRAFRLGENLGFKGNNATELIRFLQSVPAEDLVRASHKAFTREDKEYYCVVAPFPFVPSVEISDGSVQPFLSQNPIELLNEGKFFKGPFMAGVNNREGMLLLAAIFGKDRSEMLKKFDSRIPKLVPTDLSSQRGSTKEKEIASSMRWFYMKNKPASEENLVDYFDLTGDLMFIYGFYKAMKCHCKFTSPYIYEFSYEGVFNVFKNVLGEDSMPGACHADELGYLFNMDLLPEAPSDSHAYVMRNIMVKLWTNFVKFGNPTPQNDKSSDISWIPSHSSQMSFLKLGPTIENKSGVISEKRMLFWDDMYKKESSLKNKL